MTMKMPLRVLLVVLCAVLIAAMPFIISSPKMLDSVQVDLMEEEGDEIDFGRLLFSSARAEETEDVELAEDLPEPHPEWALPLDFTPGKTPDASLFSEDGYKDASILVRIEHRQLEEGTTAHIAWVKISDPSQIRTGVANPEKYKTSKATPAVSTMANKYNAVLAVNGDNYNDEPDGKPLVYRMTEKVRNSMKSDKRDVLIIDDRGDFHVTVRSKQAVVDIADQLKKDGRKLVNAYSFGPTLVKDGDLVEMNPNYQYNPNRKNPRTAIGQTGPLSYVAVVVQAGDRNGRTGLTHEELARLMADLGCVSAYNLDGGNSSEMVLGPYMWKGSEGADERGLNDIIYFASAVPEN